MDSLAHRCNCLPVFVCLLHSICAKAHPSVGYSGKSVWFGGAQLYRVAQALVVYRCAAALSIDPMRIWIMKRLSLAVFVLICASVQATYSGLVTTTMLSQHLPADQATAGAWAGYVVGMREGLGSVGYNHGYTAIEVLVAGACASIFIEVRPSFRASCWCWCSRAVWSLGAVQDSWLHYSLRSLYGVFGCRHSSCLRAAYLPSRRLSLNIAGSAEYFQPASARQETATNSLDEDGFSGRTQIWTEKIQYLTQVRNIGFLASDLVLR